MNIQLIKKKQGRRRFVKTTPLANAEEWLHELVRLKEWLAVESQFQQVGHKAYLQISGPEIALMLEVVGVPRNLEQKTLELVDLEAMEAFIYELKEQDLFTVDLETVLMMGRKIRENLNLGENKLSETYHLVLDEEKIALHFFRQKDYSQNLL